MDLNEPEKKDCSAIFQIFTEYKRCLLSGEDPATVSNGTYLVKEDNLCKTIRNRWGEDTEVFVPTTQEQAEEEVEKLHGVLGHLGIKAMLAAMKTRVSIPYAQEIVEAKLRTCNQCQFTQREPVAMQPLHPILHVCYAWDGRRVRLGFFECEGGSLDAYPATDV